MGCGSVPIQPQRSQPLLHTLFGVATLHILHIHKLQPSPQAHHYLIVKMTNQSYQTQPFNYHQIPKNQSSFHFIVNSRHQKFGRALTIELWQKGLLSDTFIGVGIEDFDYNIKDNSQKQTKVYLNKQNSSIGFVQTKVSFTQKPTDVITLMFDNALIRRKTRNLGAIQCKVKVQIGEQVLETPTCEDRQDYPPSWKSDPLTFYVLRDQINQGTITILDESTEIGSLNLNLQEVIQSAQQQIEISSQFYFKETVVAGTIKFYIKKGDKFNFQQAQTNKSTFISPKKLPPLKDRGVFKARNNQEIAKNNKQAHVIRIQQTIKIQETHKQPVQQKAIGQINLQQQQQQKLRLERQRQQQAKLKQIEEDKRKQLLLQQQKDRKLRQEQKARQQKQLQLLNKQKQEQIARKQKQEQQRQNLQRQTTQKLKKEQQQKERLRVLEELSLKHKIQQQEAAKKKQAQQLAARKKEQQDRANLQAQIQQKNHKNNQETQGLMLVQDENSPETKQQQQNLKIKHTEQTKSIQIKLNTRLEQSQQVQSPPQQQHKTVNVNQTNNHPQKQHKIPHQNSTVLPAHAQDSLVSQPVTHNTINKVTHEDEVLLPPQSSNEHNLIV